MDDRGQMFSLVALENEKMIVKLSLVIIKAHPLGFKYQTSCPTSRKDNNIITAPPMLISWTSPKCLEKGNGSEIKKVVKFKIPLE